MTSPLRQEKSNTYFELLEVIDGNGCLVCYVLGRAVKGYFDNLLYENVNDGPTRNALRSSLGFCRSHGEVLLSSGDPFGAAIVYRDILQEIVSSLRHRPQTSLVPSRECPACQYRDRFEQIYLETIVEFAGDVGLRAALNARGLCRPHMEKLFANPMSEESMDKFLDIQMYHIGRMRTNLREFLRKLEVQFKGEPLIEEEAMACSTAIEFMAGKNV